MPSGSPDNGGPNDERAVMERSIEADKVYAMDRGYAKFTLFNEINRRSSSCLCRLRDYSARDVLEDRSPSESDRVAGVLSDQLA